MVSGTPVENHLGELWTLLTFLNPDVMNLVTPGVVLHPESMLTEIDGLAGRGIELEPAHVLGPGEARVGKVDRLAGRVDHRAGARRVGVVIGTDQQ